MQALIDGDIIVHRCAAVSEEENLESALLRVDWMMDDIITTTGADSYRVFLGGDDNFRYQVFPEYKANRKDRVNPQWLQGCQNHLITFWKAEITTGYEADDALGMYQTNETIICSIDKDLLQIPGKHYNFVKKEFSTITEFEGMYHFYKQLLQGDRTDNIAGLEGIGPKKADKFLEGCETEEEFLNTARSLYNNDTKLDMFAKCLWIWRHEGDIWNKLSIGENQSELEPDQQYGSTMQQQEETNQFMEHITLDKNGSQPLGL